MSPYADENHDEQLAIIVNPMADAHATESLSDFLGEFAEQLTGLDQRQNGLLAVDRETADFGPARGQQQDAIGLVCRQADRATAREFAGSAAEFQLRQFIGRKPLEQIAAFQEPDLFRHLPRSGGWLNQMFPLNPPRSPPGTGPAGD